MDSKPKAVGAFHRKETETRIDYLATPSVYGAGLLNGLRLDESAGDHQGEKISATVHKDSSPAVQFCVSHGQFSATVYLTAHQARQVAMALAEAAADMDRMALDAKLAEEPAQLDFVNSTWPQMADEEMA